MRFVDAHTHRLHPPNTNAVSIQNVIVGQAGLPVSELSYCSIGIHPWYIDAVDEQMALLGQWAALPNVRAIGECGLDRLRGASLPKQQAVFERQIALSETIKKPVIIHCVRAFAEVLATRKRLKTTQSWVLHGINNRLSVVKPLLNVGLYASFGAALLRPNSPARTILQATPPDRILLETDDADVSIELIYEAAAECLSWSMERLTEQVWGNAQRVFGL